ncbi:MAG: APC family permease [Polyangiales bacterium]
MNLLESTPKSIAPPPSVTHAGRLRESCLSYSEVLAQSVSVIAPSTVPAAVLGLIYARAGNATGLSFLIGMLGLVLVSLNINQFARRSASSGSLYSYIAQGLGPTTGVLGGWALLFAYTLTGMSTLCGFALISNALLMQWFGFALPVVALFAIGAVLAFYIAFRDIQLSANSMLVLEGFSIVLVLGLGIAAWSKAGFAVDTPQLTLEGATPAQAIGGVVLVVFGFSGFESSTALGEEAKNPLKTIPRSVIQSVVIAGLFFIVMAYIIVLGFRGSSESLATSETPLHTLAHANGWDAVGTVLDLGILLSFFSCTLAAINSTARILFAMARHGLVVDALGASHTENRTPHVAVATSALVTFAAPAALYAAGVSAFESQGHFGTLCSFGFITVYILISLAAPLYLKSIGKLTPRAIAYALGGVLFMALPALGAVGIPGSTLFPQPDEAGAILVAVFALYMAVGVAWLAIERVRRPKMIDHLQSAIESVQRSFAQDDAVLAPAARKGESIG